MKQKKKIKKWVIYKHTLMSDGPHKGWSYIGQTCKPNPKDRWGKDGREYTRDNKKHLFFANAILAHGWDNFTHEIIETGITTLAEANTRERYWIEYYHTYAGDPECRGFNLTRGGDGTPGFTLSLEAIEKSRLKHIGKHSSPETEFPSKAIYCITTSATFESINEAARQTSCTPSAIFRCCNSELLSTNGLQWCYLEDKDHFKVRKADKFKRSLVYCVELNRIFNSYYEAERELHIDRHKISCCCKGRFAKAGDYTWKLIPGDIKEPWNKGKKSEYTINTQPTVFQYDLDNNFIASYVSQTQAARVTGVSQGLISACLNGKLNKAGGFIWKKEDQH